jgi:hypothetical protein
MEEECRTNAAQQRISCSLLIYINAAGSVIKERREKPGKDTGGKEGYELISEQEQALASRH